MTRGTNKKIRGSGGEEPQQPRVPVESPDTLRSKAWLRIVDLIGEGEIVGLVDGDKSVYFDETQLQNDDGTYNFEGVSGAYRNGTQNQTSLGGFKSVQNEVTIGTELKYGEGDGEAITRQVTNDNIDRLRVRISIPNLTTTSRDTGDVKGGEVAVSVWLQPDGGSFTQVASRTVKGKTTSKYEFTLEFPVTGSAPWNVRVQRDTEDSEDNYVQNKTFLESYTEIISAKLRYPNSALGGLKIPATQFSSVPSRYYDVKGLKIKIPSNYDPETRSYTGEWDGTFDVDYSNNPAWVFYDLMTNERYGLGGFIPESQVDKWSLYTIGQYCDEYVDDGFGGTEPRFTCNLVLAEKADAYSVIQNLASVFRGMVYWAAGSVTAVQDSPQDATYLYTPANVVDGRFTYQGASAKTRHTVALVAWNDPDDFCKLKIEYVEDAAAIESFGVQETEIVAFGCTSRGQAHRLGKWLLYTEQQESEVVNFKTGIEGLVGRPGQIIKIADPSRAGARMGGRISSSTTTTVTIDNDISGSIAGNLLSALLPDGSVEERTVTGYSGRTITVQPAFSQAPNPQGIWILKSDEIEPQTFRVIGIKEDEGGIFSVTALKHNPDKFDFVEKDLILEPRSYSNLSASPSAPENLSITESLYQSGSEIRTKITFSWDKVNFATSYLVRYRYDNENYIDLPETSFNEVEVFNAVAGYYTFEVVAINSIGKRSNASTTTKEVFGKTLPPADVEGFTMIPGAGIALLNWRQTTDLDVFVGGLVKIRHTPRTTGQSWNDAIDIIPALPGSATTAQAPLISGTYMIKFIDSSGNQSENESLIVTTVPDALALNIVETLTEHPTFSGTKTNMTLVASENAIALTSGTLIDDYDYIDDVGNWDFNGGISEFGSYEFPTTVDLEGVWPCSIRSVIDLESFDIGDFIDARTDLIDNWTDIDETAVDDVNAELYVRTTEDDPNGTPTWTVWKKINTAEYSARGFQFKLICSTGTPSHNLYIRELQVTIDMYDRVENIGPVSSGAGTYSVAYQYGYFDAPSVAVTALNMVSGDYYTISNADEFGFDIIFKNSSNVTIDRQFSVLAKGYGRLIA